MSTDDRAPSKSTQPIITIHVMSSPTRSCIPSSLRPRQPAVRPAHRRPREPLCSVPWKIKTCVVMVLLHLATAAQATDQTANPDLDVALGTAPTRLDRMRLLPSDEDWVFDYFAHRPKTPPPIHSTSKKLSQASSNSDSISSSSSSSFHSSSPTWPGSVVNANAATFPAAVNNGMTMAWITLGPCAMLPPHWHQRASNYVVAVEGETDTWMVLENGARLVRATLTPGKMSIFPRGSLHAMANTGCGNATLISALDSEDTGTLNIATGLFKLPEEIIRATFGNSPALGEVQKIFSGIPGVGTGASVGSAECLARCSAGSGQLDSEKRALHDVDMAPQDRIKRSRVWHRPEWPAADGAGESRLASMWKRFWQRRS